MYPQGRCVYVPTRDPTSRADFEQVDELWTPVTTTNKYLQIKMDVILVSCKTHWAMLWAVSCTHRVDVSMCQPGTQRHARILNKWLNYGPMWPQLLNSDLWRWMSFLWVAKCTEASSELFHVPTGKMCLCANQGPNVTRRFWTSGWTMDPCDHY